MNEAGVTVPADFTFFRRIYGFNVRRFRCSAHWAQDFKRKSRAKELAGNTVPSVTVEISSPFNGIVYSWPVVTEEMTSSR